MDPHQQPIHNHDDQNFVASQYAMYPASEDDNYLVYNQMQGYQGVVQQHPGPPPRGFFCLLHTTPPQPRSDLPISVLAIVPVQAKCPKATSSKRCSIAPCQ